MQLTVSYADGSKATVRCSLGDQVAAERAGLSVQTSPVEFMSRAAHHALKASGQTFDGFDAWLDTVDMVAPEDEPADPTTTTPGSD